MNITNVIDFFAVCLLFASPALFPGIQVRKRSGREYEPRNRQVRMMKNIKHKN